MIRIYIKLPRNEETDLYYQSEKIIEIKVNNNEYNIKTISIMIRHEDNIQIIYKKFVNVIDYSVEEI